MHKLQLSWIRPMLIVSRPDMEGESRRPLRRWRGRSSSKMIRWPSTLYAQNYIFASSFGRRSPADTLLKNWHNFKVFFSCGGRDGTYMIASSARRQLGMNNTILLLRIPGVGVLTHPKHPDTTFFTSASLCFDTTGPKEFPFLQRRASLGMLRACRLTWLSP